jgi:dGTPase
MINQLIEDVIATTSGLLAASHVTSLDDVRKAKPMVAFSDEIRKEADELKLFLRDNLYRHYQVERMTHKARRIVTDLFNAFNDVPRLLPTDHQVRARNDAPRAIADYIAGMTDRYAIREHRRLFAIAEL